jgi:ADP-ribose pyrophosphatase
MLIYRGKVLTLNLETIHLPSGGEFDLEIARHPGGAAIVALNTLHEVCLLRQYRHIAQGWLWELPAGKRDGDEDFRTTAQRELAEEAGVSAACWQPLGEVYSSPGVFSEVIALFLATNLQPVAHQPCADECLQPHWIPWQQALAWAESGVIQDAKSLIGLYRAQARLGASGGNARACAPAS